MVTCLSFELCVVTFTSSVEHRTCLTASLCHRADYLMTARTHRQLRPSFSRTGQLFSQFVTIFSAALTYAAWARLQVQERLYKVHRYFFERYSSVFQSMFSLPSAAGEPPEGESERNPIVLEGVKHEEFESFLSVIYPSYVSQPSSLTCKDNSDVLITAETFLKATTKQSRTGQQYYLWHQDGNSHPYVTSLSFDFQKSLLQSRGSPGLSNIT